MEKSRKKDPWIPWYQRTYTGNLCALVLALLSIFLVHRSLPIFDAILAFVYAISFPFLLSLIIYYAIRPVVQKLQKKMPVLLAIGLVYVFLFGVIAFIVFYVYPQIVSEIIFVKSIDLESVVDNIFKSFNFFLKKFHLNVAYQEETKNFISLFLGKINEFLTGNLINFISILTTILFDVLMIPFILFFLLKDGKTIYSGFFGKIPDSYKKRLNDFLVQVDTILVHFITGRIIVSACVSVMLFTAFLTIGIKSSYILAAIAFVFFIIPSVGWILASILPVLVGFSMSISMGVEVLIIMLSAAVLEGFWLTPEILGISLMIHPLTIILLLLAAGYLYGIVGLIFITPVYALLKVLVVHLYKEFKSSP